MMTPQEMEALRGFLGQLTQVQGITKDPQATTMIGAAFTQQPDAGYLLVQRAMLLDQALAGARAQIEQLQNQLQAEREQSRAGGGGGGAGAGFLDPASSWGRSGNDLRGAGSSAPAGRREVGASLAPRSDPRMDQRYEQAAPYGQAQAPLQPMQQPVQRPGLFGGGGGGGGFLGNMAATAAGVAGGAFLFQGLSGLMGNHGSGFLGDHGGARPVENTTVNNFYDSAADDVGAQPARVAGIDDGGVDNSALSDGLDTGLDDLAGNDDFGSQDDSSSI